MRAKTLLVIEDDARTRSLLEHKLGKAGYRCLTAATREEALRLVANHRPDLLILDIIRKGGDDCIALFYEVLDRLLPKRIPALFIGGMPVALRTLRSACRGPVTSLRKPFIQKRILKRVAELLPPPLGSADRQLFGAGTSASSSPTPHCQGLRPPRPGDPDSVDRELKRPTA